jgi:hypothetical protein
VGLGFRFLSGGCGASEGGGVRLWWGWGLGVRMALFEGEAVARLLDLRCWT